MVEMGFISTTLKIEPYSTKKKIQTLFCYQSCFYLESTEKAFFKNLPAF